MIGAIIGDIAGSTYEFHNIKTKNFPLFAPHSTFTDDSLMTVAVGAALMKAKEQGADFSLLVMDKMRAIGRKYPHPMGGYGSRFGAWLRAETPKAYHSFGNGSAMRVSPCALAADSLEEALELAKISAAVTHDHPEGIKGAQAVSAAIYLARSGAKKTEIRAYVQAQFYSFDRTIAQIRPHYGFDETC